MDSHQQEEPVITIAGENTYTLVMVDPDAPSPDHPKYRCAASDLFHPYHPTCISCASDRTWKLKFSRVQKLQRCLKLCCCGAPQLLPPLACCEHPWSGCDPWRSRDSLHGPSNFSLSCLAQQVFICEHSECAIACCSTHLFPIIAIMAHLR